MATPRLPDDVASALVDHPMRRMETDDMILYFPDGRKQEAARFLERVEGCARYEKRLARIHNEVADQKMLVILPELPFNNAFVAGRAEGYETVAVVPTFNTADVFMLEGGIPPDPSIIGCHEITHYVHLQQIAGFAWFWNTLLGEAYTPQEGFDRWFDEGLAVYYETKLQPGVGRLSWPFWHGAFAAGVAGHRINGGDLSASNRDFFGGNHYLIGSEFVSFLAARYGEQKLWDLIAVQGRSILFPFAIDVRFWQAYDESLSTLIDEFADDVAARNPVVARPPQQRSLRAVGDSVRYGRARDGTEALLTSDHDLPSRLVIVAPDGKVRVERDLTDVAPPRTLVVSSPRQSGGPTFTADGRSVFFVSLDQGPTYQASRLLRYDLPTDTLSVAYPDLHGVGGSISPDGTRYVFPRADGDHHDLAEVDLRTGVVRTLAVQPPRAYVAGPRHSPDGTRVAVTIFDGASFAIAVFDATTGARLATLPTAGAPVHEATWADEHRIAYVGSTPSDWRFQIYLYDLVTGDTVQVTHAPYLAFEPQFAGGNTVRFLNREGWHWTLDEVPLPAAGPRVAAATTGGAPSRDAGEAGDVGALADYGDPADATTAPAAAAPAAPAAASAGPPPPSVLATEAPASALEHLFVPSLRGPTLASTDNTTLLGLVLSGADHLEQHRWTVSGLYQFEGHLFSGSFAYANRQLAPFTIDVSASQFSARELPPSSVGQPAASNYSLFLRDRQAQLDIQRSFYGDPVGLGFAAIERYRPDDPDAMLISRYPLQRFAGPYAFASYAGVESTPYTGTRRALFLDAYAAAFPARFTTAPSGFTDLRARAGVQVPLPFLRRHRLTLIARGRELAGLSDGDPLLQVGGGLSGTLWEHSNRQEVVSGVPPLSPTQMPFVETLRGFEEHALATNRALIGDLSYRYPFIIDWGSASTFGLLPSFFLEQLDLVLFGTAATLGATGGRHASAGGSLTAFIDLGAATLSLRYQLARRLTDDRATVHLLVLGN
jgi:hypothetical protein